MIHLVYANRSNVGDWLSARAIRALLGNGAVLEHLCDEPFVPTTLGELAAAAPRDLVVVGGGGLLMDYFAPFWRGLLLLRPPPRFCIWGVGVCDWKHAPCALPAALLAGIAERSLLTVVRDERTRAALRAVAARPLPEPVPCPSLVASPLHGSKIPFVLHVDHFDLVGPLVYGAMDAAARAFAARTGRAFTATNNRIRGGDAAELQRVLQLYADADIVVTSRLHGAVLGLAYGCRVVAVAADHKIDAFLAGAGLGDWVLDCHEVARLPELLDAALAQPVPRGFVAAARREHRAVAAQVTAFSA